MGVGFGVSGFSVQVFRAFRMVKPLFIGCIALRVHGLLWAQYFKANVYTI